MSVTKQKEEVTITAYGEDFEVLKEKNFYLSNAEAIKYMFDYCFWENFIIPIMEAREAAEYVVAVKDGLDEKFIDNDECFGSPGQKKIDFAINQCIEAKQYLDMANEFIAIYEKFNEYLKIQNKKFYKKRKMNFIELYELILDFFDFANVNWMRYIADDMYAVHWELGRHYGLHELEVSKDKQ